MRTTIDINAILLANAMKETQIPVKKHVVEEGLRLLLARARRRRLGAAVGSMDLGLTQEELERLAEDD